MIEWSYYVAFLLKHFLHPPVHVKRCYDSKQKKRLESESQSPILKLGYVGIGIIDVGIISLIGIGSMNGFHLQNQIHLWNKLHQYIGIIWPITTDFEGL